MQENTVAVECGMKGCKLLFQHATWAISKKKCDKYNFAMMFTELTLVKTLIWVSSI
jgi:hypothetical protein